VSASLVVGVRCAGSVAAEKRRKTWDDLILTPLPIEEIVKSKMKGVLEATPPYLIAYVLPMLALSALNGATGLVLASVFIALTCCVVLGVAAGTEIWVAENA
jgi:hypothetical protein